MATVIGLDVGVDAVTTIALEASSGQVLQTVRSSYGWSAPRVGWAEQEPVDYTAATTAALSELASKLGQRRRDVRAIGLSGQMYSVVLLDEEYEPVRPAILESDTRCATECGQVEELLGREGLTWPSHQLSPARFALPKLLWTRRHEPEVFARIRHVLTPKDYVGLQLTGELGTDFSDASATAAFDPGSHGWALGPLRALDLSPALWPPLGESTSVLGELQEDVARQSQLAAGIRVVRGAADCVATAVSLGVVRAGRAMSWLGEHGVSLLATDAGATEPDVCLDSLCHAVPERFCLLAQLPSVGQALRWYRDVLCDGERLAAEVRGVEPYEIIAEAASTSQPGAGGVVFLPFRMGESATGEPGDDSRSRGALVGVDARTNKTDISRAVLEGIAFGFADLFDSIRAATVGGSRPAIGEVRVGGGPARSPAWRRLLADILEVPVLATHVPAAPSHGAALLAAVGSGQFDSVEQACDRLVAVGERCDPEPATTGKYREVRKLHRQLGGELRQRLRELQALESG